MSTIITLLGIAGFIAAIWLALVPALILGELRRQGAARSADALKIITLLVAIQQGFPPTR